LNEIASLLGSVTLAAIVFLIIKSYDIGRQMGAGLTDIKNLKENYEKEITNVRANVHRLSSEVARISAFFEITQIQNRKT
jgi:hypothetical protein